MEFQGSNPMRDGATAGKGKVGSAIAQSSNVTMRPRKKQYEKPTVEKALQFKMRFQPNYSPSGKDEDRRLYGCCTRTGRFCIMSLACIDPFCEGRVSTWTKYGSGVTSYFKNLKWIATSYFLMLAFFAFPLALNAHGNGKKTNIGSLGLAGTTIGNLAPINGTSTLDAPFTSARITLDTAGLIFSLLDLGACVLFLVAYAWLRPTEAREERQVDKDVISAADYSIFLPSVPDDVTEKELREWAAAVTAPGAAAATARGVQNAFEIAEVHPVEDNMQAVGVYMQRGRIFRQMERILLRIGRLKEKLEAGQKGNFCCSNERKLRQLKAIKDSLQVRADALTEKAVLRSSDSSVAAFITFQRMEAADWVVDQYSGGTVAWCCQERRLRLRGKRVTVKRAPSTSSIIWGNLHIRAWEQTVRQTFTSLIAAMLLIGSFLLLWFASWKQQQFTQTAAAGSCTSDEIVAGLDSGSINGTTVSNLPVYDTRLYCYCGTLPWAALQSTQQLALYDWTSKCPSHSCPAWFALDPAGVWSQALCVSWLRDRAITIAITVAASVAILIINALLAFAMRVLTFFEGHHSFEDLNASLALRLFFAQFANTAMLVVLINAAWPDGGLPVEFKTGKYGDFTLAWYENVGTQLMTTMIINCFTPHLYPLVSALRYWRRVRRTNIKARSQMDLNEMFVGPLADWSLRYAQLYNVFFVTFVFSSGMPLMMFIGFCSFTISYWVDKSLFMWFYRRPPAFGSRLQRTMSSLVPVALILHLGVGVWQLSNVSIFNSVVDPLAVRRYVGMASRVFDMYAPGLVADGARRVTEQQALPLFILFVLMVAASLLRIILSGASSFLVGCFNFLTCNYCRRWQFMRSQDGEEFVSDTPTFVEASTVKGKTKRGLTDIPSYNILLNPEIMSAFAISLEFARRHTKLSQVAKYKLGGPSSRDLPGGGAAAPAGAAAAAGAGDVGFKPTGAGQVHLQLQTEEQAAAEAHAQALALAQAQAAAAAAHSAHAEAVAAMQASPGDAMRYALSTGWVTPELVYVQSEDGQVLAYPAGTVEFEQGLQLLVQQHVASVEQQLAGQAMALSGAAGVQMAPMPYSPSGAGGIACYDAAAYGGGGYGGGGYGYPGEDEGAGWDGSGGMMMAYGMGGYDLDEVDEEELPDMELGGYMAGVPAAYTTSTRRLAVPQEERVRALQELERGAAPAGPGVMAMALGLAGPLPPPPPPPPEATVSGVAPEVPGPPAVGSSASLSPVSIDGPASAYVGPSILVGAPSPGGTVVVQLTPPVAAPPAEGTAV